MAEDDAIFDPSLKKKKKKKKTAFDIEAALAEGGNDAQDAAPEPDTAKEDEQDDANVDIDLDFTKKKKKKKKPFTAEDLDAVAGEGKDEGNEGGNQDEGALDDNFDLEVDFSKTKKKKKKKNLGDLIAEADEKHEDKENVDENSAVWMTSDRDYTYDELLKRAFEIMRDKNPDMAAGKKQKFVMRPPQVVRIGTKKSSFANFTEICKMLHRQPKHLLDFLLAELGTSGSVDGNSQLIIKGRFQQKQIENVLRRYIKEYVTCHTCRSPDTILQKDTRLFFLQCETCGSRCSVASIKSGFQAVTSKRAAIRAKTA
ncbi:eukaryotic translation initiation factor 2 subunit 2 isoform X2 [Tribolium castaneum]|uniref:Eukaryotic translation initiation factor 2 subunit 2 n=1 Tax=Tribolium castaneum TaxID=7070 RepID=D6WIW0_TRICA|nr:PREDICTED: eukaryotic translation initiation factor 2 subunit 2 isoform X2 [Tribolium castaneum]EFA01104.1 Eukaryotic translation initiation factor 2 subunit 2-like Protein [Tribolium castaneum]|eukprot:XP_966454.1 PREDICTED: eukaryotic translation initiation factor 2 subunit 2 isoform X2 [Tribolium castaneum]